MKATITDIKRFAVHDGDGIRTTVFFKGCPLKCVWCHNPEAISYEPEISLLGHKCTLCKECAKICDCHIFEGGTHKIDRERCIGCGKCEQACLFDALKLYGTQIHIDDLCRQLLEDRDFYESSEGGITISGGECLTHAEFAKELLRRMKEEGINTAVDTCGYVSKSAIDAVFPYTDTFLYDMKAASSDTHIKCTSKPNERIIENLFYIDSLGGKIEIRIPYVPEYNSHELAEIAGILSRLKNLTKIRLLPYHNYAASKYGSLDMENTLPKTLPSKEEIEEGKRILRSYGLKVMD